MRQDKPRRIGSSAGRLSATSRPMSPPSKHDQRPGTSTLSFARAAAVPSSSPIPAFWLLPRRTFAELNELYANFLAHRAGSA
jgi:hypothetical protein